MSVERIPVSDRAAWLAMRKRDVTASVAGCLLGVHEFITPYGLWALKSGAVAEDPEETAPMRRGRLLEPVAASLLQEERPDWKLTLPGVYLRDPDARLGATPDLFVESADGFGVVQLKTVEPGVFRKKWRDPDTREVAPPLWIAVQAIVEAHLAGATWAAVAALTVGFGVTIDVVPVPIHAGVIDRVRSEVAAFWRMVDEGRAPDPDWKRDAATIEALYAPTGEVVDLTQDNALPALADERAGLVKEKGKIEDRLTEIKAEVLTKLAGASEAVIAGGGKITARRVDRRAYEVKATSYIDLRIKRGEAA